MAAHRRAGPRLRPAGQVLLPAGVEQLDERHRHHPGRQNSPYVQRICQRDPFSGKVVTGGIVTARDSNWLLSWTFNRQPQFRDQPRGQLVGWIYGLFSDKPGNFVKKPMRECTGREICMEWLYHMGCPRGDCGAGRPQRQHRPLHDALHHRLLPAPGRRRPAPRRPRRAVNFAFLGQFAETERDTIFTTEYSMRTGMEAVYTLLDIDRGVPEVWGSTYDVRDLINASVQLRDGRKLTELELNPAERLALKAVLKSSMAPTWRSCSRTTTPSDQTGPGAFESAGAGARQKVC